MPRKTLYCVDTYERAPRGKLKVLDHREVKTADEAISKATYMQAKVAGVLAYSIDADHEFEDYGEPRILARFGETPDE